MWRPCQSWSPFALKQNEWDTELFGNFGPIHANLMCIVLTFYNGGEIIYIYIYIYILEKSFLFSNGINSFFNESFFSSSVGHWMGCPRPCLKAYRT